MFTLCSRSDPEEIGRAVQIAARCVSLIDRALDTIHALAWVERDVSLADHEHRLRGIEAQLFRAENNGSQDERQHNDLLQLPDFRRDNNQQRLQS